MFANTWQNFKLTVKATVPGSLPSFIYAYCKTVNVPDSMERAFTRKVVTFSELAKYVRTHITNDFDGWYRANEGSEALNQVCASIINTKDSRTAEYRPQPANQHFYIKGFPLPMVLVPVRATAN